MSKRISSRETPLSHPHLFQKVPYRDVRVGDIFQGKKNRKKWYRNTDVSQKESKYTYWRRKSGLSKAKPRPTSTTAKEPTKAPKPNKALLAAERRLESAVNAYHATLRKMTDLQRLLGKKSADIKTAYGAVKKARK